ncbi:MAG: hypothetical protein NTX31_07320 [Burkholderiales bacterium]|nr:hypothetical protein [Burkholderiales bacterium]
MLDEKSPSGSEKPKWPWRYPPTAAGVQVNHCKNPFCKNFGVPPKDKKAHRAKPTVGDYMVVASGKNKPCLKCSLCGEIFPMHSNLAIAEELLRISAYLEPAWPACPNEVCALFRQSGEGAHHTKFGVNRHGTPRYKCVACKKVFAHGGAADKRQHETHKNLDLFCHLMNAVLIRRLIKLTKISTSVLYTRIDFFHRQCLLFAGERERALMDRQDLGSRYISVDRQKLLVNWSSKNIRKNTALLSIASADQETGYIYGTHLNFDPEMDEDEVAKSLSKFGDHHLKPPFRRYARVWLASDYEQAATKSETRRSGNTPAEKVEGSTPLDVLLRKVGARYEETQDKDDIDGGEEPSVNARTPPKGMLLHENVVMQAHMQFVSRLLHRADQLRFFMDQESGLRAAFMAADPDRVLDRTLDGFYVQVYKEGTVGLKKGLVAQSKKAFMEFYGEMLDVAMEKDELPTENDAYAAMMRLEMDRAHTAGQWSDKWVRHPKADMREPVKLACWLTDIDPKALDKKEREAQLNHAARLYLRVSATGVDRYFMQVRRALTMAERGVVSASADYRRWFGKNAYNPAVLAKLVEMFRTYFNYCEVGKDKRTPAMRMGLARGPVAPEDIIYFQPSAPPRRRAKQAG